MWKWWSTTVFWTSSLWLSQILPVSHCCAQVEFWLWPANQMTSKKLWEEHMRQFQRSALILLAAAAAWQSKRQRLCFLLSLSLSPLAGSHLCISCLFWDSPCYSIQFSCLVPLSVYQIFTSKCHGNSTAHLHFRFQHAFPSGYWPQGRLDGWRCRAAPFFGWSMDAILSMSMGLRCFNTTWFRYIQIRMQGLRSRVFCQGLCLIDNLLCWYTEDKIWRNLDLPLDFPGCGLISCFDAKINTFLNII